MAAVTVRNIPTETHRALKQRAQNHGRSTEAEIRDILDSAVKREGGIGSSLAAIGRRLGGVTVKARRRSKTPVKAAKF